MSSKFHVTRVMFFRKKKRRKKRGYQKQKQTSSLEERFNWELPTETIKGIWIVLFFVVSGLSFLSFFGNAGLAGQYMAQLWHFVFGKGWFTAPFIFLGIAVLLLFQRFALHRSRMAGLMLILISIFGLLHIPLKLEHMFSRLDEGGGALGMLVAWPLLKLFGYWGGILILIGMLMVGVFLLFHTSFAHWSARCRSLKLFFTGKRREEDEQEDEEEEEEDEKVWEEEESEEEKGQEGEEDLLRQPADGGEDEESISPTQQKDTFTPTALSARSRKVDLPITLLDDSVSQPLSRDIRSTMESIQKTFRNFGIVVEMGEVSVGPTVTQYTLKPAEGVKLSSITALHNDLALALAAHPIRIEAPIPGKPLVGIEVPNKTVAIVRLRELLESSVFKKRKSNLMITLGKDVAGKEWIVDLHSMPHLLIAGATGSGKSVCINTLIISLLYQNTPEDLCFIMVDPKRVELPNYNGIPHLLTPVITDVKKTVNALKWTLGEMDRRFELLSKFGKRNIAVFNKEVTGQHLPYIVVVIDELADLMVSAASDVEMAIIRLSQMARAVGIHLVVATQRPSVDVITGLIKANVTTRIAFSVASQMDSRTILDTSGAEKLVGRGDMLYISAEVSKPKRIQGVYVADKEISAIAEYLRERNEDGVTVYNEEITEQQNSSGVMGYGGDEEDGDDLLPEAIEVIKQTGKASATLLQRRLKVGYARAARLLDILEEREFIGPSDGAKPRDVYLERIESFENVEEE